MAMGQSGFLGRPGSGERYHLMGDWLKRATLAGLSQIAHTLQALSKWLVT